LKNVITVVFPDFCKLKIAELLLSSWQASEELNECSDDISFPIIYNLLIYFSFTAFRTFTFILSLNDVATPPSSFTPEKY
jgi:hypothetical protein